MPVQDGTGPNGQGPLTGRGLGPCNTTDDRAVRGAYPYGRRFLRRGAARRPFGRGRGFGRGYGFFAGGGFVEEPLPTKEEEVSYLKSQASRLETALKDIQSQINMLESDE